MAFKDGINWWVDKLNWLLHPLGINIPKAKSNAEAGSGVIQAALAPFSGGDKEQLARIQRFANNVTGLTGAINFSKLAQTSIKPNPKAQRTFSAFLINGNRRRK